MTNESRPVKTAPRQQSTEKTSLPTQRAQALLFLYPQATPSPAWRSVAACVLAWQISWLRSLDIAVYLIADETATTYRTLLQDTGILDGGAVLWEWQTLDRLMEEEGIGAEGTTLLIMPAPLVTDVPLEQILWRHERENREITTAGTTSRRSEPLLSVLSGNYFLQNWRSLRSSLPDYARNPTRGYGLDASHCTAGAAFARVVDATESEQSRIRALWLRSHPSPDALSPDLTRGAYCLGAPAHISPSARLRAPVVIAEGVTVGEHARIGPWAVLGPESFIGERAWVERGVIGRRAILDAQGSVYEGEVGPAAHADNLTPVVKARLSANFPAPQLWDRRRRQPQSRLYAATKRALDVDLALLALVLVIPVLLVCAFLCLVAQGWPITFRHQRLGRYGRHFKVLKLRTMRSDARLHAHAHELLANSARHKLTADPRVTPLGRILRIMSIDEMPQFLNVLSGTMSIVGPRPIEPREVARYGLYAEDMLSVLPGLTGLWQVSGRSLVSYAQRITLDIRYADTCSLYQDLAIILRTVPAILFHYGAE